MQPAPKQQLSTMGVENIFAYAGFTEENLREYYENPPAGMITNGLINYVLLFKLWFWYQILMYIMKKKIINLKKGKHVEGIIICLVSKNVLFGDI